MSDLRTIGYFANTSWFLHNFRLADMRAAQRRGLRAVAIAPEDEYSSRFKEAGIDFIPLPMKRRDFTPWGKWKAVRRLREIHRKEKIDLMHHFTLESILVGTLAAGKGGPKVVQSVTGMGFVYAGDAFSKRMLRMILNPILGWCFSKGPVIAENRVDVARIRRMVGSSMRYPVEQLPGGGIDISKFSPDGERVLEPSAGQVRFLSAGRLLRGKGAGLFAEAAKRYEGPRAEFLLAGLPDSGNPESYSVKEVKEWSAIPGFQWLGNVEDMPSLLRSVDVLVHPTFYGEGLPRIIMEAQACGLPVITTNIPACAEAVEAGRNGWVLEGRDTMRLADLMRLAASDPAARAKMGKRNRELAVEKFDQTKVIRMTMNVYRNHFPNWNAGGESL